jgi:hypothetical protein
LSLVPIEHISAAAELEAEEAGTRRLLAAVAAARSRVAHSGVPADQT